jgi:ABC-type amino acid transport substrate-binding protein
MRGQIGGIKVYPFDRIEEAMTDLAAGRITAVMKVAPVAAWFAAKGSYLCIVPQVPDDPPTTRDRIREGSGGALGCCERRTRSDGRMGL